MQLACIYVKIFQVGSPFYLIGDWLEFLSCAGRRIEPSYRQGDFLWAEVKNYSIKIAGRESPACFGKSGYELIVSNTFETVRSGQRHRARICLL